ncbi:hypothetical protein FCL40_14410 [Ferrimonas sediminicola]|uniref:Uncharacterized protein n=1 Tax=Ferrimonas sediminicola TaxID=2569538 RepID=A0A4U1BB18_9GAMM|nr:hypothetical protein [Ferrimonas sediminicola]TKB47932.1 hypothetical protein FCL40_14410 [Ferrimonas sediminicola]
MRPLLLTLACVGAFMQQLPWMLAALLALLSYLIWYQPRRYQQGDLPQVLAGECRVMLSLPLGLQGVVIIGLIALTCSLLLVFWQQQCRSGLVLIAVCSLCKTVWNFLFIGKLGSEELLATLASIIGAAILMD